jgi:SAM-dependent methyltransferase
MDKQANQPWQLVVFNRSIKKQQKLKALMEQLGESDGLKCLFITCGDNNGALNWHFRANGGQWTWTDVLGENNAEIAGLLGEPVLTLPDDDFPFPDEHFDRVVSIDVLEHIPWDQPFLREVCRVLKKGGRAILTVPNGNPGLLANRIKLRLGMTPEVYGHTRAGYTAQQLSHSTIVAGLNPLVSGGYSRFFTEMIELVINYGYVFILARKPGGSNLGHIAPVTANDLTNHGMAYRLYSIFYPIARLVSNLDSLLSHKADNAVIVVAERN